ncbi:T9SS type A sorting domain-containing protein [bacterium]|nr:T9SS type A sorting domain-containing protein [bacterium]
MSSMHGFFRTVILLVRLLLLLPFASFDALAQDSLRFEILDQDIGMDPFRQVMLLNDTCAVVNAGIDGLLTVGWDANGDPSLTAQNDLFNRSNWTMIVVGDYLFAAASGSTRQYSIADPENPVFVREIDRSALPLISIDTNVFAMDTLSYWQNLNGFTVVARNGDSFAIREHVSPLEEDHDLHIMLLHEEYMYLVYEIEEGFQLGRFRVLPELGDELEVIDTELNAVCDAVMVGDLLALRENERLVLLDMENLEAAPCIVEWPEQWDAFARRGSMFSSDPYLAFLHPSAHSLHTLDLTDPSNPQSVDSLWCGDRYFNLSGICSVDETAALSSPAGGITRISLNGDGMLSRSALYDPVRDHNTVRRIGSTWLTGGFPRAGQLYDAEAPDAIIELGSIGGVDAEYILDAGDSPETDNFQVTRRRRDPFANAVSVYTEFPPDPGDPSLRSEIQANSMCSHFIDPYLITLQFPDDEDELLRFTSFDVSNPDEPVEVSVLDMTTDEYYIGSGLWGSTLSVLTGDLTDPLRQFDLHRLDVSDPANPGPPETYEDVMTLDEYEWLTEVIFSDSLLIGGTTRGRLMIARWSEQHHFELLRSAEASSRDYGFVEVLDTTEEWVLTLETMVDVGEEITNVILWDYSGWELEVLASTIVPYNVTDAKLSGTRVLFAHDKGLSLYEITDQDGSAEEPAGRPFALDFTLHPNPTNGAVRLTYHLSVPGPVDVRLFDMLGREVWHRSLEHVEAGQHEMHPGGLMHRPSGTYFIEIQTREARRVEKLLLIK